MVSHVCMYSVLGHKTAHTGDGVGYFEFDQRFEHPGRTWESATPRAFSFACVGAAMANETWKFVQAKSKQAVRPFSPQNATFTDGSPGVGSPGWYVNPRDVVSWMWSFDPYTFYVPQTTIAATREPFEIVSLLRVQVLLI